MRLWDFLLTDTVGIVTALGERFGSNYLFSERGYLYANEHL